MGEGGGEQGDFGSSLGITFHQGLHFFIGLSLNLSRAFIGFYAMQCPRVEAFLNQSITNTLALPINKMLYMCIYVCIKIHILLCDLFVCVCVYVRICVCTCVITLRLL
jgi:hypothetical protein